MSLITYKCPNCGGRIEFDSTSQRMLCPFCETSFDVAAMESLDEALTVGPPSPGTPPAPGAPPPPVPTQRIDWQMPAAAWTPAEQDSMLQYTCRTCAGELISDTTLGATSCPYCGNPVVFTERFSGTLKPDAIIPFKLTKDHAKAALLKYYEGKPLLPKRFKEANFIDEIKGVYVPYWLFDTICEADAVYRCTKVRHYSDRDYDYTETSHYSVQRTGNVDFQRVPVDGSSMLADDMMESIEPFDFKDMVPFQTAFFSGFVANKYDVDVQAAIPRAEERMGATVADVMESSVSGYTTVDTEQLNVRYSNPRCTYAMLPVYLLSTTFDGVTYTFAMNGQTGLLVGDLPVDKSIYWSWFFRIGGIVMAAIFVAGMIFKLVSGW